jgi:hypothetical protein
MFDVGILALVPNAHLPKPAPARTRDEVPAGYGTQEQCLPFTVAAALGFLIPSPISFGFCLPEQMPPGARAFRSPLECARPDGTYAENRMFYVKDDPNCAFVGNAYRMELEGSPWWYEPGISFFDRRDQVDLFKVHLPYIWRTPADIEMLLLSPINRDHGGLTAYFAVVETQWYANPVNLVFRRPHGAAHIAAGDAIAQTVFVPRYCRRPTLQVIGPDTQAAVEMMHALRQWQACKAEDRSAYKRLSRSLDRRDLQPEEVRLERLQDTNAGSGQPP